MSDVQRVEALHEAAGLVRAHREPFGSELHAKMHRIKRYLQEQADEVVRGLSGDV